ncbi:transposase-like protein [Streptomyces griseochromogenes]|uniref:Transposase-like protein n=1 Tax=Streptomyces griseochromogenes TaxID=68214 RepID=A0ABS4LKN2_9ACTN|nr:transposase-like protein [Streptomyces griseochromogenes]
MSAECVCPRCGQDWVRRYRFKADGTPLLLCTECDSLWWPDETVGIAQAHFLDDVVAARLGVAGNPWSDRVWADVIEPAPDSQR